MDNYIFGLLIVIVVILMWYIDAPEVKLEKIQHGSVINLDRPIARPVDHSTCRQFEYNYNLQSRPVALMFNPFQSYASVIKPDYY